MANEITLPEQPDDNGIYTLEDGTRVRKLKNGTLFNVDTKKFMSGPDKEFQIQPGEQAQAMARRKASLAREKAAQGALLAALLLDLDVADAEDAWGAIVAKRAGVALVNDGRDGTDAARFVGKATGFMYAEEDNRGGPRTQGVQLNVDDLMKLANMIDDEVVTRTRKAQAIDAKVSDE